MSPRVKITSNRNTSQHVSACHQLFITLSLYSASHNTQNDWFLWNHWYFIKRRKQNGNFFVKSNSSIRIVNQIIKMNQTLYCWSDCLDNFISGNLHLKCDLLAQRTLNASTDFLSLSVIFCCCCFKHYYQLHRMQFILEPHVCIGSTVIVQFCTNWLVFESTVKSTTNRDWDCNWLPEISLLFF